MDDLPAVASGQAQPPDEFAAEESFDHLPFPELLQHPNWKARKCAFDAAASGSAAEVQLLGQALPRLVKDTTSPAFDTLLGVVAALLNADADLSCSAVCDALLKVAVEKGLTGRKTAATNAREFLAALTALGKGERVMDVLAATFSAKAVKLRVGAVSAVAFLLQQFGSRPFSLKPLLGALQGLFKESDPNIRREALAAVTAVYQHNGATVKSFLTDLRDKQLEEVDRAFSNAERILVAPRSVKGDTPQSVQPRNSAPLPAAPAVGMVGPGDLFEQLPEKHILSQLTPTFWGVVQDKNLPWKDRSAAVRQTLHPLLSVPRLASAADYTDVVKLLRDLNNDPQKPLVTASYECINAMASALRGGFAPYIRYLLPALFDKFKDKKTAALAPAQAAIATLIDCGSLTEDQCFDEIRAALLSKLPNQRAAIALWSAERVERSQDGSKFPRLAASGALLVKVAKDDKLEVREAAGTLIRALRSVCGAEIDEGVEDRPPLRQRTDSLTGSLSGASVSSKPSTKPAQRRTSAASVGPGLPRKASLVSGSVKKEDTSEDPLAESGFVDPERALQLLQDACGDEARQALSDVAAKEWRTRVAAFETLAATLKSHALLEPLIAHVRAAAVGGLRDPLVQGVAACADMFRVIVDSTEGVPQRCVAVLVKGFLPKIGEMKCKAVIRSLLTALCELQGLKPVFTSVVANVKAVAVVKVTTEAADWIALTLSEFAASAVDVKMLLDFVKNTLFEQASPAVKAAGTSILVALRHRLGPKIDGQLSDVDPRLRAAVEKSFAEAVPPDVPQRSVRAQLTGSTARPPAATMSTPAANANVCPVDDDIPRADVSAAFAVLVREMTNGKDWKDRGQAVRQVEDVVNSNGRHIAAPGVNEMFKALKLRLDEPNKNVVIDVLRCMSTVAESSAVGSRPGLKYVFPAVSTMLGDQKAALRDAAFNVCRKSFDLCGSEPHLVHFVKLLASDNQCTKLSAATLLASSFSAQTLPTARALTPLLAGVLKLVVDRNGLVRAAAEEALSGMARVLGVEALHRAAGDTRPADQKLLRPVLDRLLVAAPAPTPTPGPLQASRHTSIPARHVDPAAECPPSPPAEPEPLRRPFSEPVSARHAPEVSPFVPAVPARVCTGLEIMTGLKTAGDAGVAKLGDDFRLLFERDETVGTVEMVQALLGRLHLMCCREPGPFHAPLAESVLRALSSVFTARSPPKQCTAEDLYQVSASVFDCLLSEKLAEADQSVVKAFNMLTLRLIENSEPNSMFEALLGRLGFYSDQYVTHTSGRNHKYIELVARCLLKMKYKMVRVETIILCTHRFLSSHPPSSFKDRDDLPIRSIKTILGELCRNHDGDYVRHACVELIGDTNLVHSFIGMCIERNRREYEARSRPTPCAQAEYERQEYHHDQSLQQERLRYSSSTSLRQSTVPSSQGSARPEVLTNVETNVGGAPPPDNASAVALMFAKVRKHTTTDQGVIELYHYRKHHAACAEFEHHYNRCSDAFKSYLDRRLGRMAEEDAA